MSALKVLMSLCRSLQDSRETAFSSHRLSTWWWNWTSVPLTKSQNVLEISVADKIGAKNRAGYLGVRVRSGHECDLLVTGM